MTTHRTHPHTNAFHRNRVLRGAHDFIGLNARLPFFTTLTIPKVLVDPRNQTRGERHCELLLREIALSQRGADRAINIQNTRGRIREQWRRCLMHGAHLI